MTVSDSHRNAPGGPHHVRPARMAIEASAQLSYGSQVYQTRLLDISATGVRLQRPRGWMGVPGESWNVRMTFSNGLQIGLTARVTRVTATQLGLGYTLIPEDKQVLLWDLLGGYADILEEWDD